MKGRMKMLKRRSGTTKPSQLSLQSWTTPASSWEESLSDLVHVKANKTKNTGTLGRPNMASRARKQSAVTSALSSKPCTNTHLRLRKPENWSPNWNSSGTKLSQTLFLALDPRRLRPWVSRNSSHPAMQA